MEDRKLRSDLIEMYKLVNEVEKIRIVRGLNYANILSLNLKMAKSKRIVRELNKRRSCRFYFLTNRIVSKWNELSEYSISAKTVNSFKARVDKEMNRSKDCNGSAVG